MLWLRKSTPVHDKSRAVGLDITSSRTRGISLAVSGKLRSLQLDEASEELLLFVALDGRTPTVGQAGYALCRKSPHAVCTNFLPALAQPREWRNARHTLTPDSALDLTLGKLRSPVVTESEAIVLALPNYLTAAQISKVVAAAARTRLPLKGTAVGPLAIAADRAGSLLAGKPVAPEVATPEWVVPLRPRAEGPGTVVVIDADEYALSATVILVERDRVRVQALAHWPRFATRVWKDRLLNAVADRCIRLCRRDPRDSADAEQLLYEQLDTALDRVQAGQRVNLTIRTAHWFQDVIQQPEEIKGHCATLARDVADHVRELTESTESATPPRAIWLTHEAGRLPGLARMIHMNMPEGTATEVLPPDAMARAAVMLAPQWLAAELPRAHLDATIPLVLPAVSRPTTHPATHPATTPQPKPGSRTGG